MRYWRSYRFVFDSPNWPINLGLGAVCLLIPFVGQMVLTGYCFEIVEQLLRRRRLEGTADSAGERVMDALPVDEDYASPASPDFTFNRFSDYLMRGVWPFLVWFIVGTVVGMAAVFFLIVGMAIAGLAAAGKSIGILIVLYGLFWIVYAFVMGVAKVLATPMYLRAGLSGDFSVAFSMDFFRDFMKRVGKEVVLAEAFLMVTGTALGILGLLLCYVGLFPAMVLMTCAQHHLEYQLYELYLERGGREVALKVEPAVEEDDEDREAPSSHIRRPRPGERSTDIRREDGTW